MTKVRGKIDSPFQLAKRSLHCPPVRGGVTSCSFIPAPPWGFLTRSRTCAPKFHLFVEDFVEHWEFEDQRARLGRMFGHGKMITGFTPKDTKNPTRFEHQLQSVITDFEQLQKDRERADYDGGWRLVETDVRNAIGLVEDVFTN